MGQRVHAVIGGGTGPTPAINTALADIINEGDAVAVIWTDEGRTDTLEDVYDYLMQNKVQIEMVYAEGNNPHKSFRGADHVVVQKVRNPFKSVLEAVQGGGAVLFLWDDDENPEDDPDEALIEFVFKTLGDEALVLELNNGLAPISRTPGAEIPSEEEIAAAAPAESDEDEDEPVRDFTKAELETMPAPTVKAYGAKKGAKATTKVAIIAELFPEDEQVQQPPRANGHVTENLGTFSQEMRAFAAQAIRVANAWDKAQED